LRLIRVPANTAAAYKSSLSVIHCLFAIRSWPTRKKPYVCRTANAHLAPKQRRRQGRRVRTSRGARRWRRNVRRVFPLPSQRKAPQQTPARLRRAGSKPPPASPSPPLRRGQSGGNSAIPHTARRRTPPLKKGLGGRREEDHRFFPMPLPQRLSSKGRGEQSMAQLRLGSVRLKSFHPLPNPFPQAGEGVR